MKKKLKQVTDNIHGTIFLSNIESELISTPYFYRLHDIYQSSTVYMTFPSNRTKRYEHSLGTMSIASSLLFSAVCNASNDTKSELFQKLQKYFEIIFNKAINQSERQVAPYFTKCRDKINYVFSTTDYIQNNESLMNLAEKSIKEAVASGDFVDSALDYFQYYPMDINSNNNIEDVKNLFLYRCLLQSVRIVALFHDVGHPPYSHIIEDVLDKLYDKYKEKDVKKFPHWQQEKIETFKNTIGPYATQDNEQAYKCQTIYSQASLLDSKLHERIGLSLLQSSLNDVIPKLIINIADSSKSKNSKIANILYQIMVVEFSIAMLVEKDMFFKSFHKIVDGVLDADRLDYIMRDSLNSGVNWGKIPYDRLINLARLNCLKKSDINTVNNNDFPFVIAFPKKVSDDIVDLLLIRYKIFARINFHHRCMKTAVALQAAVQGLAENYLSVEDKDCINPDIHLLWSALKMAIGNRQIRIIQWNDSWLISVLHKALVRVIFDENYELKENLEEILLNNKRYYSLIKRGSDSRRFVKKVFEYAGITDQKLNELKNKEYKKYYCNFDETVKENEIFQTPTFDAMDSIRRLRQLETVKENGDLELLNSLIPLNGKCINDTICEKLENLKTDKFISDFKTIVNNGRGKTGLPSHKDVLEEIYLYENNNLFIFNENITLREQIKAIEKNVPWIYVYFVPQKQLNDKEIIEVANQVFDEVAKFVGARLKDRYEELFGSS